MRKKLEANPWPLNILMIAPEPFFTPRGTPFSEYFRIKALTEMGHRVHLVTYHLGEDVKLEGLTLHRIASISGISSVPIGPSFIKIILDIFVFFKAFSLLNKGDYHMLHTHEEAAVMGVIFRWLYRIPHLYDMHSDLSQQLHNFEFSKSKLLFKLFRFIERWILKHSDYVIGICPSLGEAINKLNQNVSFSIIENSPLPYDEKKLKLPPKQIISRIDKIKTPIILYTGTLEAYQGLNLLFDTAKLLISKNVNFHFLLVGGTKNQANTLEQQVSDLKLTSYFTIISQRPPAEIPFFFERAKMLISPRVSGTNTPLKIYSYLASKRPILATDLFTHTQVLNSEVSLLVKPTVKGFVDGIEKLLKEPELCQQLLDKAFALYESNFSYHQYYEKVSHAVETMMEHWEKQTDINKEEHYSTRLYRRKEFAQNFDLDRFGTSFGKTLAKMEFNTFERFVDMNKDETLLDAGGGTGRLAIPFSQKGMKVTIIDHSIEMMSIAREKAHSEAYSEIELVTGSIDELPFDDEAFDWIISSRVIMHVLEWQKSIREFCRVAKKGVVFDFPPLLAFPALAVPFLKLKRIIDRETQHYHVIHVSKVISELKRQGFYVVVKEKRFFLPIGFHRKLNNPTISLKLENIFRMSGLTSFFGAPATVCAIRDSNSFSKVKQKEENFSID